MKPLEYMFFVNWDMVMNDKPFRIQGDNNLISVAHEGSGLKGRDFKKRKKGTQVINK